MILVDSSVWIDHFRGIPTPEGKRLANLIRSTPEICTSGVVLFEILRGFRPGKHLDRFSALMNDLVYLPLPREGYLEAAALYRKARREGITVESKSDFLIAACAIHHNVPLLHRDLDFDKIAEISRLKVA